MSSAQAAPRIATLLVDDHPLIRRGLRSLLEDESDIVVIGEAGDGREATQLARALRPDVVVMDIAMPRLNGMEATRQILDLAPLTAVLVLTAHDDRGSIERMRALGASGYMLKQDAFEHLATAIRAARDDRLARGPASASSRTTRTAMSPRDAMTLSRRQAEVLQLIAEGKANKESAAELGISIKTVEKHRQSLMRKLDIHEVAGLTRYAIAMGVIEGRDRDEST